jgi:hypothetical protein
MGHFAIFKAENLVMDIELIFQYREFLDSVIGDK